MPTFDTADVRRPVGDLAAWQSLDRNGGTSARVLTGAEAREWVAACRAFQEAARKRGRDIFAGRIPLDEEFERAWFVDVRRSVSQDLELWEKGLVEINPDCGEDADSLEVAKVALGDSLRGLDRFLRNWVTPQLAVGPSARVQLDLSDDEIQAARRKLAGPPPAP